VSRMHWKYADAYQIETVGSVINSGRPVAEIARESGANEGTLGTWMNMAEKRGEVTEKSLAVEDRARPKGLDGRTAGGDGAGDPKNAAACFASQGP
jgi:transposase-like protein